MIPKITIILYRASQKQFYFILTGNLVFEVIIKFYIALHWR